MHNFLDYLSDALMGAGALIVTFIIILIGKLFGLLKEDHEKNMKLTKKQVIVLSIWIIGLSLVQIWAFLHHTNH